MLLDHCLTTTYFKYNSKYQYAIDSPVLTLVAKLYMEEVESKALGSFRVIAPSDRCKYVDDTWAKFKDQRSRSLHWSLTTSSQWIKTKFTREDTKDNRLPFLECAVLIDENRNHSIDVYWKSIDTGL